MVWICGGRKMSPWTFETGITVTLDKLKSHLCVTSRENIGKNTGKQILCVEDPWDQILIMKRWSGFVLWKSWCNSSPFSKQISCESPGTLSSEEILLAFVIYFPVLLQSLCLNLYLQVRSRSQDTAMLQQMDNVTMGPALIPEEFSMCIYQIKKSWKYLVYFSRFI